MMDIAERHWLHPREFSELYGISQKHTYELLLKGLLPATKRKGFGWLINKNAFEKELQAQIEMKGDRS